MWARTPLGPEVEQPFLAQAVLRELTSAAQPLVPLQKVLAIIRTLENRMLRETYLPAVLADIVRGGGATMLVAIMGANGSNRRAMSMCCNHLSSLALPYRHSDDPAHDPVNRECAEIIAAAGGATAVVTALRDHSACDVAAAAGCGALCNMSYASEQAAASVAAAGGLLAVMEALRMHWASLYVPVASNAVSALTSILLTATRGGDSIAGHIKAIVDDGCIAVLLAVFRSRRGDAGIQSLLPTCLNFIAESSPENRAAVVAAGGGEYVADVACTALSLSSSGEHVTPLTSSSYADPLTEVASGTAVPEFDAAGGARGRPDPASKT